MSEDNKTKMTVSPVINVGYGIGEEGAREFVQMPLLAVKFTTTFTTPPTLMPGLSVPKPMTKTVFCNYSIGHPDEDGHLQVAEEGYEADKVDVLRDLMTPINVEVLQDLMEKGSPDLEFFNEGITVRYCTLKAGEIEKVVPLEEGSGNTLTESVAKLLWHCNDLSGMVFILPDMGEDTYQFWYETMGLWRGGQACSHLDVSVLEDHGMVFHPSSRMTTLSEEQVAHLLGQFDDFDQAAAAAVESMDDITTFMNPDAGKAH